VLTSASEAVASVVSDDQITVVDAADFTVGYPVWHDESETRLWVARISGTTVTFEGPPAEPFAIGDTLTQDRLRLVATIANTLTTVLGTDHQLRWTVTYTDASVEVIDRPCYVVASVFRESPRREDCARLLATTYPSMAQDFVGERLRHLTLRAQAMVRRAIQETGRYGHLTGDSQAFYEAGLVACKIALIDEGLVPRNVDQTQHTQQLHSRFHGAIMQALKTLTAYDDDESGTIESHEYRPLGAIPIQRY
jgi:hypothetical protein